MGHHCSGHCTETISSYSLKQKKKWRMGREIVAQEEWIHQNVKEINIFKFGGEGKWQKIPLDNANPKILS